MKKHFITQLVFSLILNFSLYAGASQLDSLKQNIGVLYNINSGELDGCNALLLEDGEHILTMDHCRFVNGDSTQEIDLNDFIFVAGEDSSITWGGDWEDGEDSFFRTHRRASRIQKLIKTQNLKDSLIITLDRKISTGDGVGLIFDSESSWDNMSLLAYVRRTFVEDGVSYTYFRKELLPISIIKKESQSLGLIDYRITTEPSLYTASVSGAVIVNADGRIQGMHHGSRVQNMTSKVAIKFDESNRDSLEQFLKSI